MYMMNKLLVNTTHVSYYIIIVIPKNFGMTFVVLDITIMNINTILVIFTSIHLVKYPTYAYK